MNLEVTPQLQQLLDRLEKTQDTLFITGKAGTGKSTLLTLFRLKTKKKVVVLAPTGVAALHVRGETIHSFFKFKPNITVETAIKQARGLKKSTLIKNMDTLIIDEVSMVRADLLDCIDVFLKTALETAKPFGGKQVVFIGDLYQLPPVVTPPEKAYFQEVYASPYFFSAEALKDKHFMMDVVALEKIYRQQDETFITLLNAVRDKTLSEEQLKSLNKRVNDSDQDRQAIYLTTTNAAADAINQERLFEIKTKSETFEAAITEDFDMKSAPTEQLLSLKVGAQVMFLNNDMSGQWVNGSLGEVQGIDKHENALQVQLYEGPLVTVRPHTWDLYRYVYHPESKMLDQEKRGSFTQFPLKLAWAMTIHKSQGKTFDQVVIDLGRGAFASGQVYVALSRCRTLEGVILRKPLQRAHVIVDIRVINFMKFFLEKNDNTRSLSAS